MFGGYLYKTFSYIFGWDKLPEEPANAHINGPSTEELTEKVKEQIKEVEKELLETDKDLLDNPKLIEAFKKDRKSVLKFVDKK